VSIHHKKSTGNVQDEGEAIPEEGNALKARPLEKQNRIKIPKRSLLKVVRASFNIKINKCCGCNFNVRHLRGAEHILDHIVKFSAGRDFDFVCIGVR
jgi:hypothetical protein